MLELKDLQELLVFLLLWVALFIIFAITGQASKDIGLSEASWALARPRGAQKTLRNKLRVRGNWVDIMIFRMDAVNVVVHLHDVACGGDLVLAGASHWI